MEQTEQTEKPARITSRMIAKAMGMKTAQLDGRIRTIKRRLPRPVFNPNAQYPSWSFSRKGARTLIRYLHLDNGLEKQL